MGKCRTLNSNSEYVFIFSLNVPSAPNQVVTSWNICTEYRAEGDLQSKFTAKQWTVKLLWQALIDLCVLQAKRAIGTWWKMMNKLHLNEHVQDLTSCVKLPYIPTGRLGFFWTGVTLISQRLECSCQKTWFLEHRNCQSPVISCFSRVFVLYLCSCFPPQPAFPTSTPVICLVLVESSVVFSCSCHAFWIKLPRLIFLNLNPTLFLLGVTVISAKSVYSALLCHLFLFTFLFMQYKIPRGISLHCLTPMMSSTSSVLRVLATWAAMVVPNAMGPEGMRLGGPSLAPVGVNIHKLYREARTRRERERKRKKENIHVKNIHNCVSVQDVVSKCPLHLHCCILPRSKVQIHQLLLLQKWGTDVV